MEISSSEKPPACKFSRVAAHVISVFLTAVFQVYGISTGAYAAPPTPNFLNTPVDPQLPSANKPPVVSTITGTPFRATYLIHKPVDDPNADRVAVYVIVQTGAADLKGPQGLLHYVEHLAWLNAIGAQARKADRDTNAWTNRMSVGYWLTGVSEDLPNLIRQVSGVFRPITLDRTFMRQERDILMREYDLRRRNNIDARVGASLSRAIYLGSGYARSPLGTPQEINSLSMDEALALHKATHRPGNAVLVVYGNVTGKQLRAAIPDMPHGKPTVTAPPPFKIKPLAGKDHQITLRFPDPHAVPHLVWRRIVRLDQPQQIDVLTARLALLRDILNTNLPGGLAGPLRFDAFVTRSFSIFLSALDERHVEMVFSAEPDMGVTLVEVKTAFETALAASTASGIPPETYTRVRKRFSDYWPEWLNRKKLAIWMASYVVDSLSVQSKPLTVSEIEKIDDQLTRESLNRLLRKFGTDGRTVIAYVGTKGELN